MPKSRKILIASLLSLLLAACGVRQQGQLTLIVEGLPAQDIDSKRVDGNSPNGDEFGKIFFVNKYSVLDSYYYYGGCDTFSMNTSSPFVELFIFRQPSTTGGAEEVSLGGFSLFQSGDTVRVSYQPAGGYHAESLSSPELTKLYMLDSCFWPIAVQAAELSLQFNSSYFVQRVQAEKHFTPTVPDLQPIDSLWLRYNNCLRAYEQRIDSLVQAKSLPPSYERYYRYRMGLLSYEPLLTERWLGFSPPPLSPVFAATLNDSLCSYISYWVAMAQLGMPLVRPSGNGDIPKYTFIESSSHHESWVPDQRGVFDRLSEYADSVPPHTLNLMRYLCVDLIRAATVPVTYPEADKQLYLDKYRALTTDFLDVGYTNLNHSMNLPFRFFIVLAELTACMLGLYALYRYFLRKRLSFVKRRLYLLFALVLSLTVPLVSLSAQLQLVEKNARWISVINTLTMVLFCIYLLGCIYLLYELVGWLRKVDRMHRNSWRIPAKGHTLCILMYDESKPGIVGRNIFFSWDDWWHPVSREARDRMRDSQQYRVQHWHTLDSLLLAMMRISCWANPLLRLYNKELQRVNDMAASNYIYCARVTTDYTATEEAQTLSSGVVCGLAGSDYELGTGAAERGFSTWLHNIKYQIVIAIVLLLIAALLLELVSSVGELSATSLFG